MALNVNEQICGLTVCPVMSTGSKPQLSIELRDLNKIKGPKDKETGITEMVFQSLSQRAISSVQAYLLPELPLPVQEMLANTWCENTNEELYKFLKSKGQSVLEFHKGISQMIEDNTEESESASSANPDFLMSKLVMTMIGKSPVIIKNEDGTEVESLIPTPLPKDIFEYRSMIAEMFNTWSSSDENVQAAFDHTIKAEKNNGRLVSGQIRPKALPKSKATANSDAPEASPELGEDTQQ